MKKTRSGKVPSSDGQGIGPVPRKWAWHHRTLTALRDRLLRDEALRRAQATEGDARPLALGGDSAVEESEHDLAFAFLAADGKALELVEAALERLRQGTYGICEISGSPIPADRLRAVPWCRYLREVEIRLENSGEVPKPHLS